MNCQWLHFRDGNGHLRRVKQAWQGWVALALVLGAALYPEVSAEDGDQKNTLDTILSMRQLTPQEGKKGLPIHIRGIVTHAGQNGFYLDDGMYGVYVLCPQDPLPVQKSDVVDIRGKTCTGAFAPADIMLEHVEVLGQGTLPAPKTVSFAELDSAAVDCRLVQVQGVVRGQQRYHSRPGGTLKLLVERFPIEVGVKGVEGEVFDFGIGARVRVVGIAAGRFNKARQMVSPRIAACREDIHILESPPPDLFDRPLKSTADFFRFGQKSDPEAMVRIEGVVIHSVRGEYLFIHDDTGSLRVSTAEAMSVSPGTRVEVVGFAGRVGSVSILEDALVRQIGDGKTVAPRPVNVREILAEHLDAELVTVEATLRGITMGTKDWTLLCQQGNDFFKARWTRSGQPAHLPWKIDSRLRLSGVVVLEGEVAAGALSTPREFELLLRTPQEVELLASPPWWDARKLAILSGVLSLVAAVVTLWVWELRREVRLRGTALAEVLAREAQQEERQRIGRELHDTFAQGLTGLGYELGAMEQVLEGSSPAKLHLNRAFDLLRRTREESRRGILNIRAVEVEAKNLPTFLADSLALLLQDAPLELDFEWSGTPRPLSADVQSNLVRIAQEAAANTLRHAQARRLRVELVFEADGVRLTIADDGIGFDATKAASSRPGRFGLCSMRERAQQIGATYQMQSERGNGTRISLRILGGVKNQTSAKKQNLANGEKAFSIPT